MNDDMPMRVPRKINRDLVVVFFLVAITGFIFYCIDNQRAFLNFFYLPVLFGAYCLGKRYATLAAVFSIILVSTVAYIYPTTFSADSDGEWSRWLDLGIWGCFLVVTGYTMGMLYEQKERSLQEVRATYQGVLEMLSLVIDSVDRETHNHSYRVSLLAEQIAREVGCSDREVEQIRIAGMLHDLGKIGTSAAVLNKLGKLTEEEQRHVKKHPRHAAQVLKTVGGELLVLIPMILYHHEKFDGSGYHGISGKDIPLGARIIAVADVYDALAYDRPYRSALSPEEAIAEIVTNTNRHFDPEVVTAFMSLAQKLRLDTASPLAGQDVI
jgi:putative nucleotidyltransferase with HDIG domain